MERAPARNEHLILQTAFIGDLLLSLPLFSELRRLFPEDKLVLLCRKGLGDLMLKLGAVDEVIEADKSSRASWQAAVRALRSRRFDLLLSPHQSTRSLLLAWRAHANRKIAYKSRLGRFVFTDLVERPLELPEALRQLALLTPVEAEMKQDLAEFTHLQGAHGGQASPRGDLTPVPPWAQMRSPALARMQFSKETLELVARYGLEIGNWIFLAPGSVWATKRWTESGFTLIAEEFVRRGFRVALMGAPNEREICERIAAKVPGAVSLAGQSSLFTSGELLGFAKLLVCNDSGAMHLAAAAGTPTVAIFGPTILEFGYRPWQDDARVVQIPRNEMPCRPCGKHGSQKCPLGTHACMVEITPAMVIRAADELLTRAPLRSI